MVRRRRAALRGAGWSTGATTGHPIAVPIDPTKTHLMESCTLCDGGGGVNGGAVPPIRWSRWREREGYNVRVHETRRREIREGRCSPSRL
jgi:hypothetical protein